MLEKIINELTEDEKNRLNQLKERDEVTNLIIENLMADNDTIDFEIISALEKRTFEKMDYYHAAEVLFNTRASVEWIKIVLNIIVSRASEEVVSFIQEVVYAYRNNIKAESISQFIDCCDSVVDLHTFCSEIIHVNETNDKVRQSIENIPQLLEKIELDNSEAKQSYLDMKREVEKKEKVIKELENQLDELKEKGSENSVSDEEYTKAKKKAAFFEKKYNESQVSLRKTKDECVHLKATLENKEQKILDFEMKLQKQEEQAVEASNNMMADQIKELFEERFNKSMDNIAKTVSHSYSQVLDAVKGSKAEASDSSDLAELKKIIEQQKNIIESLQNISIAPVEQQKNVIEETVVKEEKSFGTDIEDIIPVQTENDVIGVPVDIPESIQYEEPNIEDESVKEDSGTVEIEEPQQLKEVAEEEIKESVESKSENAEPDEKTTEITEHKEVDIKMCKAPGLINSQVTTTPTKDDKEEKKISFFSRMKFKRSNDKKQKQLILDTMLRKRIPVKTITDVKNILNSGKVDNYFVFELINDDRASEETIRSALEFVS